MKTAYIFCVLFFLATLGFGCRKNPNQPDSTGLSTTQVMDTVKIVIDKSQLTEKEFLAWNYDEALAKLGEPLSRYTFPMNDITEFEIELLGFFPSDPNIFIKELTFEVDSEMYLTIWYAEKDGIWKPVHFKKYSKYAQF